MISILSITSKNRRKANEAYLSLIELVHLIVPELPLVLVIESPRTPRDSADHLHLGITKRSTELVS